MKILNRNKYSTKVKGKASRSHLLVEKRKKKAQSYTFTNKNFKIDATKLLMQQNSVKNSCKQFIGRHVNQQPRPLLYTHHYFITHMKLTCHL